MSTRIKFTGFLTKDAIIRVGKSGKQFTTFSVAVHDRVKSDDGKWVDRSPVVFWDVVDWRGVDITTTLKKGTLVNVEGNVRKEEFNRKNGSKGSALRVHINGGTGVTVSPAASKPVAQNEPLPLEEPF